MVEILLDISELKKWASVLEFEKEETLLELIARLKMLGSTARPRLLGETANQFFDEYSILLEELEKSRKKMEELCKELNSIAERFERADRA